LKNLIYLFYLFLGLYWGIGPQLNLSLSMLNGWSLCYNNTYNVPLNGFQLITILNQCNKSKLLLGCGPLITPNIYSVAAMDYRINVLYNCSNNYSCSHISNGLQWYFSDNSSWGFAGQSDNILRNPCDTTTTSPYTRLCWHTVPGWDGYRCSSILFNTSIDPTLWQRAVWHAD
jgi:hypothetical protein